MPGGPIEVIRDTIFRRLYRSHRCVAFGDRLAGPPAVDRVDGVVFRLATPADLERLDEFEPYGRGSRQRAYVERDGEWLFVACDGDRIVATARYGRVIRDAVLSRVMALEPWQVWGADQFCLPAYRNRGISRLLAVFANRWLVALGYTEVTFTVDAANIASIRMTLHKGCRALFSVSYVRILRWERLRVSKDVPQHLATYPGPTQRR